MTNLRSLRNKIEEVTLFLEDYKPELFCVTETWLTKEDPNSLFIPRGFSACRYDRETRGGGLAFIIRNDVTFKFVEIPVHFRHIEVVCVDLRLHTTHCRFIAYYRSGGFGTEALKYAIDSIECLKNICSTKHTLCLMGDFNLPDINWLQHSHPNGEIYTLFMNFFNNLGLHQLCSNLPVAVIFWI